MLSAAPPHALAPKSSGCDNTRLKHWNRVKGPVANATKKRAYQSSVPVRAHHFGPNCWIKEATEGIGVPAKSALQYMMHDFGRQTHTTVKDADYIGYEAHAQTFWQTFIRIHNCPLVTLWNL